MKLSEAQRELLALAARPNGVGCIESYRPARKLIEMGLAIAHRNAFGYQRLELTDVGRAAITAGQQHD